MNFYYKRKGSQAPPFMEHCDGEDMTRRIAGGAMNQLGNTSKMITMKLLCALLAAFIAVPARTATVPPPLPPGVKVTHPDGSPLRAALGPVPESQEPPSPRLKPISPTARELPSVGAAWP